MKDIIIGTCVVGNYLTTAFTGIRLHGMKIEKNANGSFTYIYTECDDKDRNFPTKMYRFPMPQAELDNNGAVLNMQNGNKSK